MSDLASTAARLADSARKARLLDIDMIMEAGLGHIGGDFSAFDILTVLYDEVLNIDPENPRDPKRDRFVMSKGHASGALYVTLARNGFFPLSALSTYMKPLSKLNGHPDRNKLPGVETNTGPLGHGIPVAAGIAMGARLNGDSYRTYALCGDGELQEGSNWEAFMFAGHQGLDNLTVIVDRNRFQQGAATDSTVGMEPLDERFRSFGFAVKAVDGHNHAELLSTFASLPLEKGKPTCLIANTIKGKGVSFMENLAAWHHKVPSAEQAAAARIELGAQADAEVKS